MVDDRLNLGRLSKMDLDGISGINVLVNGIFNITKEGCLFNGSILRLGKLIKMLNA